MARGMFHTMYCHAVLKKEIKDGFSGFRGDYSLKAHFLDEVRVNGLGFFPFLILPSFIHFIFTFECFSLILLIFFCSLLLGIEEQLCWCWSAVRVKPPHRDSTKHQMCQFKIWNVLSV